MAFHGQIGCIDLEDESVVDDRLVFDLKRLSQRVEVVLERVVVLVLQRRGHDPGEGELMNASWKSSRILGQRRLEVGALCFDRLPVGVGDLADGHRHA